MNPWIYVVIVLAAGYPVVWWLRGRDQQRLFQRASQTLAEQYAAVSLQVEQAREQLERARSDARAELAADLDVARAEAEAERGKSERYFKKISDFERERDQWQRLYTEQSIGHGNAQNLMMGTIEALAKQLQDKGVRVQVPKVIHTLREEFLEAHEMPARALAEALKDAQAQQPPPAVAPAATGRV